MEEQLYSHAFSLYGAGRCQEAAEVFHLLAAKAPLQTKFWFGLGASLQELARYGDALQAWAMCALLDRNNPTPHFHAAECYFSQSDKKEARKALAEADLRTQEGHPLKGKISVLREQWA